MSQRSSQSILSSRRPASVMTGVSSYRIPSRRQTGVADFHLANSIYRSYERGDLKVMLNIHDWPSIIEISKLIIKVNIVIGPNTSPANYNNPNKDAAKIVAEAFGYDSYRDLLHAHSLVHQQLAISNPTSGGKKTRKGSIKKRKVSKKSRKRSTKKHKISKNKKP